ITKHTNTVAVSTPLKAMPVPGVERIEGFTTTMEDIVKNVVMPAMASVRRLGLSSGTVVIVWLGRIAARSASLSRGFSRVSADQNKRHGSAGWQHNELNFRSAGAGVNPRGNYWEISSPSCCGDGSARRVPRH